MLPVRYDSVQLANLLPGRIPTKIEILRREFKVKRQRNIDVSGRFGAVSLFSKDRR